MAPGKEQSRKTDPRTCPMKFGSARVAKMVITSAIGRRRKSERTRKNW